MSFIITNGTSYCHQTRNRAVQIVDNRSEATKFKDEITAQKLLARATKKLNGYEIVNISTDNSSEKAAVNPSPAAIAAPAPEETSAAKKKEVPDESMPAKTGQQRSGKASTKGDTSAAAKANAVAKANKESEAKAAAPGKEVPAADNASAEPQNEPAAGHSADNVKHNRRRQHPHRTNTDQKQGSSTEETIKKDPELSFSQKKPENSSGIEKTATGKQEPEHSPLPMPAITIVTKHAGTPEHSASSGKKAAASESIHPENTPAAKAAAEKVQEKPAVPGAGNSQTALMVPKFTVVTHKTGIPAKSSGNTDDSTVTAKQDTDKKTEASDDSSNIDISMQKAGRLSGGRDSGSVPAPSREILSGSHGMMSSSLPAEKPVQETETSDEEKSADRAHSMDNHRDKSSGTRVSSKHSRRNSSSHDDEKPVTYSGSEGFVQENTSEPVHGNLKQPDTQEQDRSEAMREQRSSREMNKLQDDQSSRSSRKNQQEEGRQEEEAVRETKTESSADNALSSRTPEAEESADNRRESSGGRSRSRSSRYNYRRRSRRGRYNDSDAYTSETFSGNTSAENLSKNGDISESEPNLKDVRDDAGHVTHPVPRRYFTQRERNMIYNSTEGHCGICGRFIPLGEYTIDHIIPLSKGGTNDLSNLQPCCSFCNKAKDDSMGDEFFERIERIYLYQAQLRYSRKKFKKLKKALKNLKGKDEN